MFGNRLGWGISAVIWATTVFLLWQLHRVGTSMSAATAVGKNAATFTMQLPVDPRTIANWMTEPGDAVDLYKQAIAEYQSNARPYNAFNRHGTLDGPELAEIQKGMNLLIRASRARGPGVFADRPGEMITYDADRLGLVALDRLGQVAYRLARLYAAQGAKEKARPLYEARFSLGLKLAEERLVWAEWDLGRNLMVDTRYLPEYEPQRAELFKQFDEQFVPFYKDRLEAVTHALFVLYPSPPDCAAVALRGGDVMWRVEATLALGRCKYTAQRFADERGCRLLIDQLVSDDDPRIRLAAAAARDLTIEQWRKLTAVIER